MGQSQGEISIKELLKLKPKFIIIISRFGIRSSRVEDVLQDFFLKILRQSDKDGKSYLERYDGSTTLATYLYKPLQNLCMTLKTRENSRGGMAITTAARLEEAPLREADFDGSVVYLENFMTSGSAIEDELLAYQLLAIAKERYSNYTSKSEKGLPRSVYMTVLLMYNGLTKAQTARLLNVSSTFVDSQLKKFQNDAEVLKLKKEWIEFR